MRTLSHDEARAVYDWVGAKQDSQGFYEDAPLAELTAQADFGAARSVVEFGCGTGRFAETLLAERLPPDCRYRGYDISPEMVRLARERLGRFGDRAEVVLTDGGMEVGAADGGADRFVVTYVFDLLSEEDIRALIAEARRVLAPGGLLCAVGLTPGRSLSARIVGAVWHGLHRLSPRLVGGCRALRLAEFLGPGWTVRHRGVVTRFGVASEVLVAERAA